VALSNFKLRRCPVTAICCRRCGDMVSRRSDESFGVRLAGHPSINRP
jgi:hypothetical protein